MKNALVFRHVAFEDLGLLEPLLLERGYRIRIMEMGAEPLDEIDIIAPDLLVTLGGPIGVYEEAAYPFLTQETALIKARLFADRPTLGFCLGAQLMAKALGAPVAPNPKGKEIGFGGLTLTDAGRAHPVSLLGEGPDRPVLHWHGDQFATPDGCQRLAETMICAEQGFSRGSRCLALQFHLEAPGPAALERWLIGHACELSAASIAPQDLRAAAAAAFPDLALRGRATLSAWLDEMY